MDNFEDGKSGGSVAQECGRIVAAQRAFFASGETRTHAFRSRQLRLLEALIVKHEKAILEALRKDLGKPGFEAYVGEYLVVLREIRVALGGLAAWMKPRWVSTSLLHFYSSSSVVYRPLGVSLIIAPWNFPFQLSMAPLVAAIASGNCAIVKPSEQSPATQTLMEELITPNFRPEYIRVMGGGPDLSRQLVHSDIDHVFFTGGKKIGAEVAMDAARRSIPVSLELGGKNPCIILADADFPLAMRRLVWGKAFNCGQSCVAPDYLLVPRGRKQESAVLFRECSERFFGVDAKSSGSYGRIINDRHMERLLGMLVGVRILHGGDYATGERYLAPTLVEAEDDKHPVLSEEIFGPILPILEYGSPSEALKRISSLPPPLAAYVFTGNAAGNRDWMDGIRCGSLVVNDTIAQFLSQTLPFGGTGASGNVKYHGWYGFAAFSHAQAVFQKSTWFDIALRYPPYGRKLELLRKIRFF
jgi:aldehyde dehydrogenase (NAD+)